MSLEAFKLMHMFIKEGSYISGGTSDTNFHCFICGNTVSDQWIKIRLLDYEITMKKEDLKSATRKLNFSRYIMYTFRHNMLN